MSSVKLVSITPDAEQHITYCARVSSEHQDNPEYAKLLKYCIDAKHWSIFEQATATFEIECPVAIATQMLRHKSFNVQMLSRRYASHDLNYSAVEARQQAAKNRQSSEAVCDAGTAEWFADAQWLVWQQAKGLYDEALTRGIAREQARFLLPQNTTTRMYWSGSIRSFIHWIQVRTEAGTQLEHQRIAVECRDVLTRELPTVAAALGWSCD